LVFVSAKEDCCAEVGDDFAYAHEWPEGWIGIDKEEFPNREVF